MVVASLMTMTVKAPSSEIPKKSRVLWLGESFNPLWMSLKSEGNLAFSGQPTIAAVLKSATVEFCGRVMENETSVDNRKVTFIPFLVLCVYMGIKWKLLE